MSLEIESADVIRLIQQYLKENKLTASLRALQDETSIALNTVDSVEEFTNDVKNGRWDLVLRTVAQLALPASKLYDLYEQVILELLELSENSAARSLLRETDVMHSLQQTQPDRYLRLEKLCSRMVFDLREAYHGDSKDKRRKAIAQALSKEVVTVPPSRLLTLLGQALKWQQQQGAVHAEMGFDLFRNTAPVAQVEMDTVPERRYACIKFPKKQRAECCTFSPDGQYFVTGSTDGILEVWNYFSGKLRRDLKYQAEDNLMLMEEAIYCLAFNQGSDMLASGAQNGQVAVWRVQTGQLLKQFSAHQHTVSSVDFSLDGSQVLSSGHDQLIRLHGLKSGKMLKEFRGHTAAVSQAKLVADGSKMISGDVDGAIKVWQTKTVQCLLTVDIRENKAPSASIASFAGSASVVSILLQPDSEQVVICCKNGAPTLVSLAGKVTRRYPLNESQTVADGVLSAHTTYLYILDSTGCLSCFDSASGEHIKSIPSFTTADPTCVAHHPRANIIAACADNGEVTLWKA